MLKKNEWSKPNLIGSHQIGEEHEALDGTVLGPMVLEDHDGLYYIGHLRYFAEHKSWMSSLPERQRIKTKYVRFGDALTALTLNKGEMVEEFEVEE